MNREILFKAKRLSDGEWIEGNYCEMVHGIDMTTAPAIQVIRPVPSSFDKMTPVYDSEVFMVYPETVCQLTGIKDFNGRAVWEGDIIKCKFRKETAQVRYGIYQGDFDSAKTAHCGFYVDWNRGHLRKDLGYLVNMLNAEVFGNIHDNPELLEVENE